MATTEITASAERADRCGYGRGCGEPLRSRRTAADCTRTVFGAITRDGCVDGVLAIASMTRGAHRAWEVCGHVPPPLCGGAIEFAGDCEDGRAADGNGHLHVHRRGGFDGALGAPSRRDGAGPRCARRGPSLRHRTPRGCGLCGRWRRLRRRLRAGGFGGCRGCRRATGPRRAELARRFGVARTGGAAHGREPRARRGLLRAGGEPGGAGDGRGKRGADPAQFLDP